MGESALTDPPITREMIRRAAQELDAWSDDALRETIDAWEMAHRVLIAALRLDKSLCEEQA